jgi:hypothetical protein
MESEICPTCGRSQPSESDEYDDSDVVKDLKQQLISHWRRAAENPLTISDGKNFPILVCMTERFRASITVFVVWEWWRGVCPSDRSELITEAITVMSPESLKNIVSVRGLTLDEEAYVGGLGHKSGRDLAILSGVSC